MAKLTLKIIGDNSDALNKIEVVKNALKDINNAKINFSVQSSGLDAVAAKLKEIADQDYRAVEAAAKLANAEARKINAQTKAAVAAEKLSKAQKEQAQSARKAAQANERVMLTTEQIQQKMLGAAQQTDYLRGKTAELYNQYLSISRVASGVSSGQQQIASSMELVIRNAGALQVQVRGLAAAYGELSRIGGGNGGFGSNGTINMGGSQQAFLPESNINWDYYQRKAPNIDMSRVIESDWREVTTPIMETADAANTARQSFVDFGGAVKSAWANLSEGTPITDALGDSIGNIIVKITTWQVVNGIVASIKRSFKDALETMKEVDSELVTVRKVTGFTADEMKVIEEQAYKTASAYGVAANEYLESVAAFARAGYKEQSTALAELSTKTQIVGDTTAETANQFLLSVDAAYKYQGSIESLSKVLDGANEIDNKYATSIEKIAEGMGIVAPVAAQMNVSIDELAAAIGTITAVTQRSGSEAARALRALFLNIAGDTKTEIDEGVTWTTGEIDGLRDVIKLYAKDAWDAAQASEGIIDPMRAIEGLAKSMQDGILSEQKLIEMVSDIGGKLRTSQLLAIIQNWDMYQSMLQDYAGAIGSADKEVENALDSWERKTNQLKNTWTQFISDLISSNSIKQGIDLLNDFVKFLDSGVGKVVALTAAFLGFGKVLAGIIAIVKAGAIYEAIQMIIVGAGTAAEVFGMLTTAMLSNPLFWGAAAAALVYGIVTSANSLTEAYEKQKEELVALEKEYDSLYGDTGELEKLKSRIGELTDAELERLGVLESQKQALEDQLQAQRELAFTTWRKTRTYVDNYDTDNGRLLTGYQTRVYDFNAIQVENARNALYALDAEMEAGQHSQEGYNKGLKTIVASLEESAEAIRDGQKAGIKLTESEAALLKMYDELSYEVGQNTVAIEENVAAAKESDKSIQDLVDDLVTLEDELAGATAAIEAFNEATKAEKGDTFKDYAKIYEKFLEDWGNGLRGSNVVKNAIEAIFGADAILAAGGDWEALGEMLANDFWRGVFSDKGDDYGANFMNALADFMDANGDVIDSNGKVVASFEATDETLTLTGYDLEGLARMLGTTPDVIMSLVDAWDIWSSSIIVSKDEMMQLANTLGAVTTTGAVDATKFLEGLASDGEHSAANIVDLYNALQSIEGIEITNVPDDIAAIIEKAGEATEAAEGTEKKLDDLDDVEATPKVELDTTLFDLAIDTVKRTLDELSRTRTIIHLTTGSVDKEAKGTDSAPGGPTLVNEEGPEIIQEGNSARIVGDGKPTITYVEPGARIFDAEETRKILKGRSGFSSIKAAKYGANSSAGGPRYNYLDIPELATALVDAELSVDQLKDIVALRKQELSFLEESGAAQSEIEAKQREIQEALHAQAELLRKSEEYQNGDAKAVAEVVALSTEWWKIENKIIDAQEKIAKQLRDDIADALNDIVDALENASDAMVSSLEGQLDSLKAAHDATEARREEEEKIAAVQEKQLELEKARVAFENAQRERTVRQYNARTGRWEWVANAKNLEAAQESLKKAEEDLFDAQTDLAKYYADQAYEAQKAVLEKQIKATKEAFTSFRNTIKEASDAVKDGEMDIDEAYDYISAEMKRIYDEYGIDLTDTLKDIISGFGNVSGAIGELYAKILAMLESAGSSGSGKDGEGGGGSTKSQQFIGAMSNIYFSARERGDADTMAAANRAANEERGMGSVITAVADVALISAQSSGKSIADYSADYMAARAAGDYSAMEVANRAANILRGNGNVVTAGDDINKVRTEGGYDYGGILTGMGGIKATEHDEMVLPPDMTRMLLDAERSGAFDSLLQHLGIVTSAANGIAGFGGVMSSDRIGQQHNGDIISINGIELRNVTENTTLGELTRMAKNLALVKGS